MALTPWLFRSSGAGPLYALIALISLLPRHANAVPAADNHAAGDPRLGGVASESAVCSEIGTKLLRNGGNAVDALVATVFCVGVVGMYHSGLGGGGFMLVRSSNGSYEYIDFREAAPAAAFEGMYTDRTDLSRFGGLAR